jgi:hypothetical protein
MPSKSVNTKTDIKDLRQSLEEMLVFVGRNQIKYFVSLTRTLLKVSCARYSSDMCEPRCGHPWCIVSWPPNLFHTKANNLHLFLSYSFLISEIYCRFRGLPYFHG